MFRFAAVEPSTKMFGFTTTSRREHFDVSGQIDNLLNHQMSDVSRTTPRTQFPFAPSAGVVAVASGGRRWPV
jgi:hypothetical protein